MSPDDPLIPPHSADELLGHVLARGRAIRGHQQRRKAALSMAPALALLLVVGLVVAVRGPSPSPDRTTTAAGPTTTQRSPSTTADDDGTDLGQLPPPDLGAGGPGVTNPTLAPSTSTSAGAPTSVPGSRRAPIAVFDLRRSDGQYQTAVLRPGAKAAVPITAATAERQWPVLSPDGKQIAFASTQDSLLKGVRSVFELYTVRTDGTGLRMITASPLDGGQGSQWPSWSPDGLRIVANCANNTAFPDVCTMRPDGTGRRIIGDASGHFFMPRWSPDGASVVVVQNTGDGSAIPWILDPSGGKAPRRAPAGAVNPGSSTSFTTDGSQLLVLQALGTGTSGQPATIDLATGRATPLVGLPPGRMLVACGAGQVLYLPDVAFGGAKPGDLLLVGLDGTSPTVLLPRAAASNLIPSGCARR